MLGWRLEARSAGPHLGIWNLEFWVCEAKELGFLGCGAKELGISGDAGRVYGDFWVAYREAAWNFPSPGPRF